jgi:hypothetical protein
MRVMQFIQKSQETNVGLVILIVHTAAVMKSRTCSLLQAGFVPGLLYDATVDLQLTIWRYIPEDITVHNHCCENLISYKHTVIGRLQGIHIRNVRL